MMSQDNIEKKVDNALSSIDGIQRATPAPFFFTRLQARLQEQLSIWEKISLTINRPAVAFATIAFVLVLNAFAFLKQSESSPVQSMSNTELNEQDINSAYDFASKTNYTLSKIWNQDEQPVKK
jgi:hypothetical protein